MTTVTVPGDKIWYEDVPVLLRRWKEFFPTPDQTPTEKVNALVRLVVYATAAIFVYNREPRTLVMGAAVVAVVSFAFGQQRQERYPMKPLEPLAVTGTAECTPPTKENPFANVLLTDLSKNRGPACAYDTVKDTIKTHFNDGLFRNATDVYETQNSQRQFYTMPVTSAIPDTGAFANFLYGGMKSCKANQADCGPDKAWTNGGAGRSA